MDLPLLKIYFCPSTAALPTIWKCESISKGLQSALPITLKTSKFAACALCYNPGRKERYNPDNLIAKKSSTYPMN
jgi:hypothetical protein